VGEIMKWVLYLLCAAGIAFGWMKFMNSGKGEAEELRKQIETYEESGSAEELEKIPTLNEKIKQLEEGKSLTGILLAFVTAGLVGVVFVVDILPAIAHKFTHAVYDSAEQVEEDVMHDARAKFAQGDFEGAIAAYRDAAAADPLNRLPWVEIAKIQRENMHDSDAAIATLRQAVEGQEWQMNDAAFLMFRLAEIYDEDRSDRISAAAIMQQVAESFPETRHAANARHKLHEWGVA
jgi:tetratricopeptide (TPR) repeat protein